MSDKAIEISFDEYCDLKDTSGYYKVVTNDYIEYIKNGKCHNEFGPGILYKNSDDGDKCYDLNGECYR